VVLGSSRLLLAIGLRQFSSILRELILQELNLHLKFTHELSETSGLSLSLADFELVPFLRLDHCHIPCLPQFLLLRLPFPARPLHLASERLQLSLSVTLVPLLLLLGPLAHGPQLLVLAHYLFNVVLLRSQRPLNSKAYPAVVPQTRLLLQSQCQEPIVLGRNGVFPREIGLGPKPGCLRVLLFVKEGLYVIEHRSEVCWIY